MSRWLGGGRGGELFTRTRARVWASPTSRRYDRIIGANGFWLPSELALDFFAELSFRLWQMGGLSQTAATVYENYDKKEMIQSRGHFLFILLMKDPCWIHSTGRNLQASASDLLIVVLHDPPPIRQPNLNLAKALR